MHRELVRIDGHTIAADLHLANDERPPVVFLHGIMTAVDLAPELFVEPARESWIAVSLPGHAPGALAAGRPRLDAEVFARLVDGALAAVVGDRRVVAAGWSTGGFAALSLAIHRPARVAAVASLAGFARGRLGGPLAWLPWLARRGLGRGLLAAGFRAARAASLHGLCLGLLAADGHAAAAVPAPLRRRLHAMFLAHDPAGLSAVLAALPALDIGDRLGEIGVPAWIAGGARDPVIPAAETERIARAIPDATLRLYPGAGHLFFSEWPGMREDFAAWRAGLPQT